MRRHQEDAAFLLAAVSNVAWTRFLCPGAALTEALLPVHKKRVRAAT